MSLCAPGLVGSNRVSKISGNARLAYFTGGASPGLTNMGVAHLAKSFDRIRKVDVGIYQPLDAGGGEAVFAHIPGTLFVL